MTIGNYSSKICQIPSTYSIVKVVLLPIPIKNHNILHKQPGEQQQTNCKVLNDVLRWALQPLTCQQNSSTGSGYSNVLCADCNFRRCTPVVAVWNGDCREYSDIHHLERHVCFWCQCLKNKLGDYVPPDKQHPRCDQNLYRTLNDANSKAANAELS